MTVLNTAEEAELGRETDTGSEMALCLVLLTVFCIICFIPFYVYYVIMEYFLFEFWRCENGRVNSVTWRKTCS